MGFIKYYDIHEDHYGDVVEYAKIQDELERQRRDERKKEDWFAFFSGNPEYAVLDANTLLKFAVKSYRDAENQYRRLPGASNKGEVDCLQLWQDLWLECSGRCVEAMDLSEEKQEQLMDVFVRKLLQLDGKTEPQRHIQEMHRNRRYGRYMTRSFSTSGNEIPEYWRWLGDAYPDRKMELQLIAENYEKYYAFLSYYLYKSVHPISDSWIVLAEANKKKISDIRTYLKLGRLRGARPQCFRNPLYYGPALQQMTIYIRVLLFQKNKSTEQSEDRNMIEDLYDYLTEQDQKNVQITSILPENVLTQIQAGKLPVFENGSVSGLQPGEQIHYLNHMILYLPENNDNDSFAQKKGTLVITDKRIAFRSAGASDISLEQLDQVLRYDMKPEVLEFRERNHSVFVTLPDPDVIYQVLKMIANKDSGQPVADIRVALSYEQLVEKADLGACIFTFECLETYPLPDELKAKITLLLKKLRGLQHAVEVHPEHHRDVIRFLEYYLPETVRLVVSYNEYQMSGLEEKTLNRTYGMIMDAIDTLDAAVEERILNIYKLESMETRAKADALRQILEQDGYSKGSQVLRH